MSVLAAIANGNLTSSSTWALLDSTSYSNSESANTALTTSYVESTAFTPGAITIDGIAVKIASRAASPTGTMSIRLAQAAATVTGTEIQVNVSDVPTATATSGTTAPVATAQGGWFFVKFASPVTLLAATLYTVSAKTSSAAQVNLWSTATSNWSRYLRTTTTQAPAAGDDLIITGEWTAAATVTARTVTMNSTASTDYGSNTTTQVTPAMAICNSGTLSYGTSASTTYVLRLSGYLIVYNGGTFNQGASGSEIPRNSTATLQFDCTADGDFGLVARNGSTINMAGLSRTSGKNIVQCKLTADVAIAATSLSLDTDTGWLSGDVLCLAPTSQTATEFESKATTGNATSTTVAITALTKAHSGTSPTQAEVGLLTHNVVFTAVTANVCTFFWIGTTAVVSVSWTEFSYVGTNSAGKQGITLANTTGSASFTYVSFHDGDCSAFVYVSGQQINNFTLQNFVIYNTGIVTGTTAISTSATTGTWTIDSGLVIGITTSLSSSAAAITLSDVGGTFSNVSVSGISGSSVNGNSAIQLQEIGGLIGTFDNVVAHSCAPPGLFLGSQSSSQIYGLITNFTSYRCSIGVNINAEFAVGQTMTLRNTTLFGHSSSCISMVDSFVNVVVFDGFSFNGDTTFATPIGITTGFNGVLYLYNGSFSAVSGIKTAMASDINLNAASATNIVADNCTFNGTNLLKTSANNAVMNSPFMRIQNYNQVANDNRAYYPAQQNTAVGIIQSDSSTVYSTNPLSQKMSPASTTIMLRTSPMLIPCASGATISLGVQVRKDGTYNGNAPRLIMLQQNSMGVTSEILCDTLSVVANTWEQLTYTTSAAPQNGVFAFVVECDGTAGSVFVGDVAT